MEERKDIQIKVRITATEKSKIAGYCEEHKLSISDFLRAAIHKILKEDKR